MKPINELLYLYALGLLSAEDEQNLQQWASHNSERQKLLDRLSDKEYIADNFKVRESVPWKRPMMDMTLRINRYRNKSRNRKIVAAAVLFLFVSVGLIYYMIPGKDNFKFKVSENAIVEQNIPIEELNNNSFLPGSTQARLTSISTGESVELGNKDTIEKVLSLPKTIVNSEFVNESLCLEVPRGGEFKVMLEDSTLVWLNAESMLFYPEVFGEKERRVIVKGEAYFKVHPESQRPFYVETDDVTLRVYGTSFNIRAYSEDLYTSATLESGSISLAPNHLAGGEVMLKPGHQARVESNGVQLKMSVVDTDIVTAWRHGQFVFEEQPLRNIMRDLSRWYDFKYEFIEPEIGDIVFKGTIPRYADFKTAISLIEKSGGLKFMRRGETIIIEATR